MKECHDGAIVLMVVCILLALCLGTCGCGVHAEIDYNPVTEKWEVYYANDRLFAPENVVIVAPNGWKVVMGEQATQREFYGGLIRLGATWAGAVEPEVPLNAEKD